MSPLSVLLVEDNPNDELLIRELIEDTSIPVDINTLSDGEQAIQAMKEAISGSPAPDLVLLDLNLPKKNGHEVLEFIRGQETIAQTCVAIYTGSRSPDDMRRAKENNANCYLVKPMGRGEMVETARKLRQILASINEGRCPSFADCEQ